MELAALTFLQLYHDDCEVFLDRIITGIETWAATHYLRNQTPVNALASQWISLQADFVGAENDVHRVLGQTGSNPRRQTSTT